MKYRWSLAAAQSVLAAELAKSLRISPLLAQCLLNRGVCEPGCAETFLAPKLRHLADPFLLPDMSGAVERLFRARDRNEPLVIFGDYDVDGVTSTALLLEVFAAWAGRRSATSPTGWTKAMGLRPKPSIPA